MNNMIKINLALEFVRYGISVIPLMHRGKKPDTSVIGGTWEQYTTQHTTEYEVTRWLAGDWRNYGVVAGWNDLVIIDFDNIEYYNIWLLWARGNKSTQYIADGAYRVKTSRGMHVYITTIEPVENSKRISKHGGVDVIAHHKFVVGPGSVHPSGHVYEGIGPMVFSCVQGGIDEILPPDLFPLVSCDTAGELKSDIFFTSQNVPQTESYDPWELASLGAAEDLITKVKRMVRIENLFSGVVKTSRDGRWLAAVCPFHDDNHPSLWIDTTRQICGCQVCNFKPLDAINLYAKMHNCSESAAVSELAREIGIWS